MMIGWWRLFQASTAEDAPPRFFPMPSLFKDLVQVAGHLKYITSSLLDLSVTVRLITGY